jgi:hypothetical protein
MAAFVAAFVAVAVAVAVAGALSGLRRFGGGICPAATVFPVGTGINSSVMFVLS